MQLLSYTTALFFLATVAAGFIPSSSLFGIRPDLCLDAKHVQKKGAKKAAHRRPKKSRPSDKFRAPTNYPTFVKPEEYTVVEDN